MSGHVSMMLLVIVLATVAFSSSAQVATVINLNMDGDQNECGSEHYVKAGSEAVITAGGDVEGDECKIRFRGEVKDNCKGLCVNVKDSVFKECSVTLTVSAGIEEEVYDCANVPTTPWCTQENFLHLEVQEQAEYTPNPDDPGYSFTAAVYNKCGYNTVPNKDGKGGDDNPTFEEAAKALDGFHHGEEFDRKVHANFVHGILLGFGLSAIFLVILLITYCYYKHSPDRGVSRSVGLPKVGFTKKLKLGDRKKKDGEQDVEGQFRYNKTDQQNPETAKPLLEAGAVAPEGATEEKTDPEKPTKPTEGTVAINIEPAEDTPQRKDSISSSKSNKSSASGGGGCAEAGDSGVGSGGGDNNDGGECGDTGGSGGDSGGRGEGGGGADDGAGGCAGD